MSDELEEMVDQLAIQQHSGRTKLDQYRDFRELFRGSDLGRRVLHDILFWGHLHRTTAAANNDGTSDPYETYRREGERKMALNIWYRSLIEPSLQPREQRSPLATKTEGE